MDILNKNNYPIIVLAAVAGYLNMLLINHGLIVWLKDIVRPDLIFVISQFSLGFVLGIFFLEKWKLVGVSTGPILWGITLYGIITDFNNHNLLPIEIIFAILWVVPAVFGAYIGYQVKIKYAK